jgi:hypothetical protein
VVCNFTMSSLVPSLLPWMGVLLLLVLKPNRSAQAWWIWAPLACSAAVTGCLPSVLSTLPPAELGLFQEALALLAFGLAAVWLVSSYLGPSHRFITFLGLILVLLGFGLFNVLVPLWGQWDSETIEIGVMVAVSSLVIAAVLILAGLFCRRRYRPLALGLWVVVLLLAIWLLIISACFVIASLLGQGPVEITQLAMVALSMAGLAVGAVSPFLILSFSNDFYCERLKRLLNIDERATSEGGASA